MQITLDARVAGICQSLNTLGYPYTPEQIVNLFTHLFIRQQLREAALSLNIPMGDKLQVDESAFIRELQDFLVQKSLILAILFGSTEEGP